MICCADWGDMLDTTEEFRWSRSDSWRPDRSSKGVTETLFMLIWHANWSDMLETDEGFPWPRCEIGSQVAQKLWQNCGRGLQDFKHTTRDNTIEIPVSYSDPENSVGVSIHVYPIICEIVYAPCIVQWCCNNSICSNLRMYIIYTTYVQLHRTCSRK